MPELREEKKKIYRIGGQPGSLTLCKWLLGAQGLKLKPMFENKLGELLESVQSLIFCLKV